MLRLEALVHSIKSGESAKRPAGGEFPAGKVYNVNGNARFVALKVGLDAGIPEVQINLFCAFGLDAVDPAEVQMMSGQHEHRGPRTRFARLCRYLCRGAPASSQASNWVRLNSAVRGLAIAACKNTLSASADLATPERMSRNYARVLRRGEVAIICCYWSRAAASRCRCDINLAKTLGHGHQRPARMYTKVDRTWTSTAAL